jgi:hypothetical protein
MKLKEGIVVVVVVVDDVGVCYLRIDPVNWLLK